VPRAAPNTGTTSGAIGTAEPSRYARIYSGTSPKPVTAAALADEILTAFLELQTAIHEFAVSLIL